MRLYNGDCFDVMREIEDGSVDCIITDPPYLMDDGGTGRSDLSIRMKKRRDTELNALNNFGSEQIHLLAREFMRIQDKLNLMVWCSKNQIRHWLYAIEHIDPVILFWGKTNPAPLVNNSLLSDLEYALYFRDKMVRCNSNMRNAKRYDITSVNMKDKKMYGHPTIKPLNIVSRHLSFMSNQGDVVLDPFMGSGTTGVACVNMGRDFIGIEMDKGHFATASQRIRQAEIEKNSEFNFGGEQ